MLVTAEYCPAGRRFWAEFLSQYFVAQCEPVLKPCQDCVGPAVQAQYCCDVNIAF